MSAVVQVLGARVSVRRQMREQAANPALPGWLRVWAWCWVHATEHGHARATAGEVGRVLGLDPKATSVAIAQARQRGLLDPASNARCLVLPGHAVGPCGAQHRGDS